MWPSLPSVLGASCCTLQSLFCVLDRWSIRAHLSIPPFSCMQRAKCSEEERASLAQFHPLDELQLRPDAFPAFLCDTLGFRLVRRLQPGEAASGFHRSLLVLRKA